MNESKMQRGAGRIGTIIGVALVVLVAYGLIVYIPLRVNVYEFRDFLRDKAVSLAADQEGFDRRLEPTMDDINSKWKEVGIQKPYKPLVVNKDITITKTSNAVKIRWKMDLPVPTIFKTFIWKVDMTVDAPLI